MRRVLGVVSAEPREPLLGDPTGLDLAVSGLLGTYGVLVQQRVSPEMVERGHAALTQVGASHLAGQRLATMSAGEARRCWIARALAPDPRGLVLDEPTTGLDFVARLRFLDTVRSLMATTTVVLVTHHLEEVVPEIGRVVLMREGRIVADGPRESVSPERGRGGVWVRVERCAIKKPPLRLRERGLGERGGVTLKPTPDKHPDSLPPAPSLASERGGDLGVLLRLACER